ncbi:MAG TPA: GNAT family N-acetyltransferase, partial [Pyrinomonadaceae bacterium]|nr:GNAT family N-acetyltransferase [Pyrinomonadaceae bacterium]
MQKYDDDDALRPLGLRPATAEDTSFLMSLFASTRSEELALLAPDHNLIEAFITMQFNAQRRQYDMSYPHANHSIVLWNEAPIGRLLVDKGDREFTLVDVALLADYRNIGIGTHLMQNLLKEAATAREPVRLHVLATGAAMRLYERLGFSRIGGDSVYLEMI